MTTPNRDRATDRLSNPDSPSAEPFCARSAPAPIAVPRESVALRAAKTPSRRGWRTRRPERFPSRLRFRPQIGLLEQRALLSALPTLTALRASTASAPLGQSVTFTATVSDLSPGGATPDGGTVTFSDQNGAIGSETLVDGVAEFTTSSLAAGTNTVTASYGGTANFAPSITGTIVTAAGNGTAGYTGNKGPATAAELDNPGGMAVDSAGDLFIADLNNNVIREVVKATGDIITVAGNGKAGYSGDNGPATAAELDGPRGVAVDSAGDVFFADCLNNRVREVVKATGDIITVAGDGKAGYSGDNGPATAAVLNAPNTVAVDSAGDLFIADANNHAVREVVKATGDIITVAGNGKAGYSGDNGPATAAELNDAYGVAVDAVGDLFFADDGNNRVREVVKATGDIITVAGNGTAGYSGDNGPATDAELDGPFRVAVDSAGDVFVADPANNVVREITPAVTVTVSPATTSTAATSTSATFSPDGQTVPLSATVSSGAGTVDEGTETFTILSGTTAIGAAVTVNVDNGTASASYVLPAGTSAGTYTIQAVYNGTADFVGSTDTSQSLTVSPAATSTAAASTSAPLSTASQTVPLSASVTSSAGTVDEGTETFTILSGTTAIGAAVTVNVDNGTASASYDLPAGTPAGTYTIEAVYNGTADFVGSTDTSHSLTVSSAATSAPTSTAAASTSATFSPASQIIPLSATVTSAAGTVDEGTETFTILSGTTAIGTAVTVNVDNGTASASYVLPAATPLGTYTIQAVYNGTADFAGSTDTSHSLTVNPGAAFQVVFGQQPTDAVAGVAISPAVTVEVEDQYDNVVTTDTSTVTLTLSSGAFEGGSTTLTAVASSGVATFSDLKIDLAGTYTLAATDGTLAASGASNSFTITAAANKVVFGHQPTDATAGVALSPDVTVKVEDQYDNVVTTDSSTVILNLSSATFENGSSTATAAASNGVATFRGLKIDLAGTYTLAATDGTLTASGTSNSFTISAAAASKLVIQTQPSASATAGVAFATQPVIYEEDRFGNLETGDNSTLVTASLSSGAGLLQGTTSITLQGGEAAFSNLADDTASTIALRFFGGGLTAGPSTKVVVSPAAAYKLVIHTPPSATATAGQRFSTQPVIYEEDRFGNLETGDNRSVVTVSLNSGSGPLQGTTTATVAKGVATFTNLADSIAETITLRFTSGSLNAAITSPITITPSASLQAPTITGYTVVKTQEYNSKGKPKGKPVFSGFSLQYSAPMNPATAGLTSNYQVVSLSTKRVKGKTVSVATPVNITARYNQSNNTVTLTISGSKNPFSKGGGQITILASSPTTGVSSQTGVLLNPKYTLLSIKPNASGITLG